MKQAPHFARPLWIAAGALALTVGAIGVVLPLLPTTPFVLLAAFCFARGSQRLHAWLITHPRFGKGIDDWNRHRAISAGAKRTALATMAVALAASAVAGVAPTILGIQAVVMAGAAIFIATRRTPPGDR